MRATILVLRLLSVFLGLLAVLCCYGWMMMLTLIAGPLGIGCWLLSRHLEQKNVASQARQPFSVTLGWIGIITNSLGLTVTLLMVAIFSWS